MQVSTVRQHAGKPSGQQLQRQWVTPRPGKLSSDHAYIPCRVFTPQGQGIMDSLSSAAGGASAAIERLQRYMQPPPAGFPPGPPGDQSLSLLSDPLACISRLRREHGPLVGLLLGGERVVLVADPAAAKQVLVDQPDVFVKAGTAFFPGSSLTGNGLLVSDGAEWRRQRRLSNPAFRKAAVDRYASAMVSEAQQLLDGPFAAAAAANARQQQQQTQQRQQQRQPAAAAVNSTAATAAAAAPPPGVRDVYADFNQLTLNITLAALFSIRSDYDNPSTSSSNRAAVIVAAVEQAFTYFAARGATAMVVPEWVPTPDNVAFREAVQQLDTLVYDIIDSRAAAMARQQQQQPDSAAAASSSKPASADLLQSLLESVDDAGQPMSRTALRDELMTLLVAGQETSAILLGWAAALLAHNPKAQAAAAAEVAAVLGTRSSSSSSGGDAAGAVPGPGDLPQLPYLTAVVLEALRLWSPAYMVGRCAAKDVQLAGGYTLPAGTTCLVSPYLLHREPTRWKQPLTFRPERWMQLLQQPQQQPAASGADAQEQPGQGSQAACPVDMQQATTATPDSSGGCPYSASSSGSPAGTSSSSSSGGADGGVSAAGAAAASPAGYSFTSVLRDLGPNGAYVPFGGGPRNCIGTGFAMTEAVLVLAMLLQRYELQPVSPAAGFPRPKPMLTLRPEAVPLKVVIRQQL